MARFRDMVVSVTIMLSVMVMVAAQAPSPTPATRGPGPTITCHLPNSSMISRNSCNSLDEQSMGTQTQECNPFLTGIDSVPSKSCCTGLNEVAYNRTACICKATFYPPSSNNATRQLELPSLCGVQTDLCNQCPGFLTSRADSSGPSVSPAIAPYHEGKSMASTIGAITLAVVFGLLLVAGIVGLTLTLMKKRRARNNPPGSFEAAPPGGAF